MANPDTANVDPIRESHYVQNKKAYHIMIDLETLGIHNTAPIVSAGLAVFDPYASDVEEVQAAHFSIDQQSQFYDRHPSGETLAWWLRQEPAAQRDLAKAIEQGNTGAVYMQSHELAQYIKGWIGTTGLVWGYGSNEDIAWLGSLYDAQKMPRPWHYRQVACYRTILRTFGATGDDWFKPTIAHNPVADAVAQARTLQAIRRNHNLVLEAK